MRTGIECQPVHAMEKAESKGDKKTLESIIMYGSVSNSSHNSSLLHFYVSVLRHSHRGWMGFVLNGGDDSKGSDVKAHVLSDSGASHKFVRPQFLRKLEKLYGQILPVKESGTMKITTANAVMDIPLRKVELILNMSGYIYKGWFIVFDLVKYDIVLGKEWLAEVEHNIDHQQNILKLGWQKGNGEKWAVEINGLRDGYLQETGENENRRDSTSSFEMENGEQTVVEVVMAEIEACWKECEEASQGCLMSKLCSQERKIKQEFEDLFHEPKGLPPHRERFGDFRIRLLPGSEAPYRSPYRLTPAEWTEYKRQTREYLDRGWIRKSKSPFAAPVLFVPKPGGEIGELRMVIDYRALNAILVKDRFPLPYPEELIDQLQGKKWFSKIDFWSGYHQNRVSPADVEKTAFVGPDGLFE